LPPDERVSGKDARWCQLTACLPLLERKGAFGLFLEIFGENLLLGRIRNPRTIDASLDVGMVGGVKAIYAVLLALVLGVGCGKKEPELSTEKVITPDEAANELFVEAVELVREAQSKESNDIPAAINSYEEALVKVRKIVNDYKKSDLAVKLVSEETLFTGKSMAQIEERVDGFKRKREKERLQAEKQRRAEQERLRAEKARNWTIDGKRRVQATRLKQTEFQVIIPSQGHVQAGKLISITPEVSGRVVKISPIFRGGEFFKATQELLWLDNRNYRIALTEANATLHRLQNNLQLKHTDRDSYTKAMTLAKTDLHRAQVNMEDTIVRAPSFSGRITEKRVDIGQIVTVSTVMGTAIGTDYAEVRLPVANSNMAFLDVPNPVLGKEDSPIRVDINASIGKREHGWIGTIDRVEKRIPSERIWVNSVKFGPDGKWLSTWVWNIQKKEQIQYWQPFIARVTNPYGDTPPLRAGLFVRARIYGKSIKDAFVIPRSAVHRGANSLNIEVSETVLQEHGLTLQQVAEAVRNSEVDIPGGSIKARNVETLVRTESHAFHKAAFEKISIKARIDGSHLTLGEIANMTDASEYFVLLVNSENKLLRHRIIPLWRDEDVLVAKQVVGADGKPRKLKEGEVLCLTNLEIKVNGIEVAPTIDE